MNLKFFLFLIISAVLPSIIVLGCTKDKTPRPPEPCDPTKIYFERDIKPILNSNCAMSGCHDATTKTDGVNLATFEGVRQQVSPGRPQNSEIIERINDSDPDDRMPPTPRQALSQDQKNLLSNWILQGADNSVCEENASSCSPSNMSFLKDVQAIIASNCLGCHSGAAVSGGVNLSSYSGVQAVAQSGKLVNATSQNGQATSMPPNSKLSACDIQKIKIWVTEGAKNN